MTVDLKKLAEALVAPFGADEVKFLPKTVSGNRALAMAYIRADAVMSRLDAVFGVGGWQDAYAVLPCGSVVCTLRVRIGDEWIAKEDVGSPSKQPDAGDKLKAAFSGALKRAAVKFGIGRYLSRVVPAWADYDPQKKTWAKPPQLPGGARKPDPPRSATTEAPRAVVADPGSSTVTREQQEQLAAAARENGTDRLTLLGHYHIDRLSALPSTHFADALANIRAGNFRARDPVNGPDLVSWVGRLQDELQDAGKAAPGELIAYIRECGKVAGVKAPMDEWGPSMVAHAVQATRLFLDQCKKTVQVA